MKNNIFLRFICVIGTIATFNQINATENQIVKEIAPFVTNSIKTPKQISFVSGDKYVQLSDDLRRIECYDVNSGNLVETLFDATHTRETTLESIDGFSLSPDQSKILVWTDAQAIYRRSFTAKYYIYDTHSRVLAPLSKDFERTQNPIFSNDSRMIAFIYENNIYLKKLDYNTQVAVTVDGKKGEIINGATDWTYEEEFVTTALMAFSTDNTSLCYVKSNERDVPTYTLPIYEGTCDAKEEYALYPGIMSFKYPVAGKPNSTVTLHAYEISNRNTKELDLPDKTVEYIPRIDFIPTDNLLFVTTLNREQNKIEIFSVNPKTTICTSVYSEKSDAWIIPQAYENMTILKDGFVVASNRSGWTHYYQYAFNGTLVRTLTAGNYDVTQFYGLDTSGNAYYQAASPSPINRTVYRSDIKGNQKSLSPESGYSVAQFSVGCQNALLSYSDTTTPPQYTIINNNGKTLRSVLDNQTLLTGYTDLPQKEFLEITDGDGNKFNAYIIRPLDFKESKKYPVIMYQYSGPGSQSVLNQWGISWEQYYAQKGYVIFCVDGRGTGGRGSQFMYSVYKKLGYYETIDQLNAAKWLASQRWIDATKIGMFGWSYGGYETLMCMQAPNNPFAAGVAVAAVTDWRYYDTVYAERYMLTPQQNFDGYYQSAPINFTDRINARLLLMCGTADDNVHPANTYEFVSRLQSQGTLFDMMIFPNKNHSIVGCNARAVVYGNMLRFFNTQFNIQ